MKKIYVPMIRYGDKEFDEGFVGWGFQSTEEQERDAQGILLFSGRKNLDILDLACGLGGYHNVWLNAGHAVVGVDISETFIFMAGNTNPRATYRCEDIYDIADENQFDLVTMIDTPIEDDDIPRNAYRALRDEGRFVFQVGNPNFVSSRGNDNQSNWRTWVENDDRTFLLTRNEYNTEQEIWEYEEWKLNLETGDVVVEHKNTHQLSFARLTDILLAVGFQTVSFLDVNGRPFGAAKEEPRNYFCVARKGGSV